MDSRSLTALEARAAQLAQTVADLQANLSRSARAAQRAENSASLGDDLGAAAALADADVPRIAETEASLVDALQLELLSAERSAAADDLVLAQLQGEVLAQEAALKRARAKAAAAESARRTAEETLQGAVLAANAVEQLAAISRESFAEAPAVEEPAFAGGSARAPATTPRSAAGQLRSAWRSEPYATRSALQQPEGVVFPRIAPDETFWRAQDAEDADRLRTGDLEAQADDIQGEPRWHSTGNVHGYKFLAQDIPASWTPLDIFQWLSQTSAPADVSFPQRPRSGRQQVVVTFTNKEDAKAAKRFLHDRRLEPNKHASIVKWFGAA